jgi:hypothetical protein
MGERLLLEVELVGPFSGLKKYPNAPGQWLGTMPYVSVLFFRWDV